MESSKTIKTVAGIQLVLGILFIIGVIVITKNPIWCFGILGFILTWALLVGFADIIESLAIMAQNSENWKNDKPEIKSSISTTITEPIKQLKSITKPDTTKIDENKPYTKEVYDYLQ